jgi:hypothetical protein
MARPAGGAVRGRRGAGAGARAVRGGPFRPSGEPPPWPLHRSPTGALAAGRAARERASRFAPPPPQAAAAPARSEWLRVGLVAAVFCGARPGRRGHRAGGGTARSRRRGGGARGPVDDSARPRPGRRGRSGPRAGARGRRPRARARVAEDAVARDGRAGGGAGDRRGGSQTGHFAAPRRSEWPCHRPRVCARRGLVGDRGRRTGRCAPGPRRGRRCARSAVPKGPFGGSSSRPAEARCIRRDPRTECGEWSTATGEGRRLPGGGVAGLELALSPSGRRLAVAGDGRITVYDLEKDTSLQPAGQRESFGKLAFSSEGGALVAWGDDGQLAVWTNLKRSPRSFSARRGGSGERGGGAHRGLTPRGGRVRHARGLGAAARGDPRDGAARAR